MELKTCWHKDATSAEDEDIVNHLKNKIGNKSLTLLAEKSHDKHMHAWGREHVDLLAISLRLRDIHYTLLCVLCY